MTSASPIEPDAPVPALAVIALVALVAAILTAVVHYRPRPRPQPARPPAAVAEPPAEIEPEAPTAAVLIDAIPWGRLERIESASGELLPLPEPQETPVLLELPVGDWRVALSNPRFDGERSCDLSLAADARGDCLVEFERLTVDQYFREAGWWR